MKKRRIGVLLAFCLLALGSAQVRADDLLGQSGWKVTFTQDNQMESNFGRSDMDEAISGMQPGDNITFTLNLESRSDKVTDWYLTNEVVNSLEDRSANANTGGGAYTYYLAYEGSNRQQVLFDSDTVGGERTEDIDVGEGLHEAAESLSEYFYLDTLGAGEQGIISLKVVLDGETQGNTYQDTLANLTLNFAVEERSVPVPVNDEEEPKGQAPVRRPPKTSDDSDLMLYVGISLSSGLALLILALYSLYQSKKKERGGTER